jgi:acyl-CoA dehydrogenase
VNADMSAADGERELLRRTVDELLTRHCTPARAAAGSGWDADLWQALEETGLTLAGSPEEVGGSGGDLSAAADIAVAAGAAAAPVPLAETLAAGMLLGRAGLAIPSGPLTVAVASGPGPGSGTRLRRVPYGRLATTVIAGSAGFAGSGGSAGSGWDGDGLAVITPADRGGTGRGGTGLNLAGEPRDEVILAGDAEVHDVPAGTADDARRLLRLFRSLLIAGAAQRALDLTVTYVQEREQFGRPLARFPTVQQELARMAGEVALIGAATQAAVAAGLPGAGEGVSAVVAAKAQASSGAGVVAAIAHQLHGAIGTTEEHRLRLTTTRLWSWRDEDGSEAECFAELGRAAFAAATGTGTGAGAGTGGLWPWLSGSLGAGPAV